MTPATDSLRLRLRRRVLAWRNRNRTNVIDLSLERSLRSHPASNVSVLGWRGNVRQIRQEAKR